jgi:hypothetical protein
MGCLIAASVIAQDVTSVNVVGYNTMTFEKGKIYLVATAFEGIDIPDLHANDVVGTQLPIGSQMFFYKDSVTGYQTDTRIVSGWSTNIVFHGFMGFWVRVNPAAPLASYDVVFKGQAPMDGTTSNLVVNGLNMLGFPYTADVAFTNTQLYAQSFNGDLLYVFDGPTQNYLTYGPRTVGGWPANAKALTLKLGQGFWYKSNRVSPILDTESRPYPPANP